MKITSEIFQVGGGQLTVSEDASIYLVNFNGKAAIIDSGCGRSINFLLDNIEKCNIKTDQIQYILLTHCHYDHTGGAKKLQDKLKCKIVAHELDSLYLESGDNEVTAASWYGSFIQPFNVDIKLKGHEERIELGKGEIKAIHIPGHSPGSVAYLCESDGLKVLFGQDVHGPLDSRLLSNKEDYLQSLKRLLSLEADILCEGHFGIFHGKDRVRKFIESYIF